MYTATLIPGDGVGKEITDSVKEIFDRLNVPIEWEQFDLSGEMQGSDSEFQQAMDSLRRTKVGVCRRHNAPSHRLCRCEEHRWMIKSHIR